MKKIKVILFVFSLLMVMPNVVNAQCDYNEKNKLQSLAGNVNFSYNYVEVDNGINSSVDFSVTISNLRPELYVVDQTNIRVYNYDNNDIVINGYKPGSMIRFIVYGNTENCRGVELINNYVTLPSYNPFYKDEVCSGITNYKLCNRWTKINMSHDQFVKQVLEYKSKLNANDRPTKIDDISIAEKIIVFLSKYSFYLFGGIIIVCGGLIFYLKRKDDFDLS